MAEDAPKSPAPVTEPVAEPAEAVTTTDAPAAESAPAPAGDKETSKPAEAVEEKSADESEVAAAAKTNGSEEKETEAEKKEEKPLDAATPAKKTPKAARRKSLANLKKTKEAAAAEQKFQPGDYVLAKMRSYPPWPSVVLSKELLPEIMVHSTGPSPKGHRSLETIGAAAWETVYPIFFMGTYEYSWISVVDLEPLSKEKIETGAAGRKTKKLNEAFQEASQGFALENVKDILEQGTMEIDEEAVVDPDDEDEMDVDEEEPGSDEEKPKKRRGKKRKKSETASDDEAESEKPAKTPKKTAAKARTPKSAKSTPAKTPKAANGSAKKAAKEKTPKAKKAATPKTKRGGKKAAESESEDNDKIKDSKQLAKEPAEEQQRVMLMRRHLLQKAFLNKDKTPPKEEDMAQLNACLKSLEQWTDMPAKLIKNTKIHKVLRGIMKVDYEIPLDDKLQFKERSKTLHDQLMNVLNAVPADDEGQDEVKEHGKEDAKDEESKDDKKDGEAKDESKDESNDTSKSEEKAAEEEPAKVDGSKPEETAQPEEEAKTNGTAEGAKESTPLVKEVEMRDAPTEEAEDKKEKTAEVGAAEA